MYKKREVIRIVIQELKAGNKLAVALSKTRLKSKTTFYNWKDANPRLKMLVERAEEFCEGRRTVAVEDALFKSAIAGNVTSMIFYLTNRDHKRWADKRAVFNNMNMQGDTSKTIVQIFQTLKQSGQDPVEMVFGDSDRIAKPA